MRRIMVLAALGAAALAGCYPYAAQAQQSYPTAAAGVRVPGTVPLSCDSTGAACAPASAANPLAVAPGPLPAGATVVGGSQTLAATAMGVTLAAGGVTKRTYICGFAVTGAGATAASTITVTVTNPGIGNLNYKLVVPAGAGVSITPLIQNFSPCLPAGALNLGIAVSVPSFGTGNTDAALTAWGYWQ